MRRPLRAAPTFPFGRSGTLWRIGLEPRLPVQRVFLPLRIIDAIPDPVRREPGFPFLGIAHRLLALLLALSVFQASQEAVRIDLDTAQLFERRAALAPDPARTRRDEEALLAVDLLCVRRPLDARTRILRIAQRKLRGFGRSDGARRMRARERRRSLADRGFVRTRTRRAQQRAPREKQADRYGRMRAFHEGREQRG